MSRFDDMFDGTEEMTHVSFSFRALGKTISITNDYEMDIQWTEVLDDVISALEAAYGYKFHMEEFIETTGRTQDD